MLVAPARIPDCQKSLNIRYKKKIRNDARNAKPPNAWNNVFFRRFAAMGMSDNKWRENVQTNRSARCSGRSFIAIERLVSSLWAISISTVRIREMDCLTLSAHSIITTDSG